MTTKGGASRKAKKSVRRSSPKANALTVQRIFDATPKVLWSYWTDPEKFARWFNPAPGLDLVVHEYDARVGGRVRFDMPQPDGNPNPQEGVFHALEPYREIVSGSPDKSFLIAVRLAPVGSRTRMIVTVTGVPVRYRDGARRGWNAGFDKLMGALEDEALAPRTIAATRVLDAPRDVVWRMWTEPDQIAQWWGPNGFENSIDSMDVRPGGEWKFVMHGPDGRDYLNRIRYLKVVKPEQIVYDHVTGPSFRTTVIFTDLGGKTKISMRALFPTKAVRDRTVREYGAEEGMQQTLGRLVDRLANLGPSPNEPTEVVLTRVFNAPRERVWRAWTESEQVKKWWGPKDFTAPHIEIDLRVGGAYTFSMKGRGLDGKDMEHWVVGTYQEIVPYERIVARMSFADEHGQPVPASYYHMPGDWPPEVLLTVVFEDLEAGKTKLTLRERGIPEVVAGFTGLGWNQSLDKFAACLASMPKRKSGNDSLVLSLRSDREVVITRVFDAPPERVYRAYTDPAALVEWWGPRGYGTKVEAMDVRPGGAWRFVQHDLEGREHAFRGEYREVVPNARISQTFEYEGTPGHVVEQASTFEPLRGGQTRVTVTSRYRTAEDLKGMVDSGMEWGMRESYERLDELLSREG